MVSGCNPSLCEKGDFFEAALNDLRDPTSHVPECFLGSSDHRPQHLVDVFLPLLRHDNALGGAALGLERNMW